MTKSNAVLAFEPTGPCGNRFKVVDYKIVILQRQLFHISYKPPKIDLPNGLPEINPTIFPKHKTESFIFISYGMTQLNIR